MEQHLPEPDLNHTEPVPPGWNPEEEEAEEEDWGEDQGIVPQINIPGNNRIDVKAYCCEQIQIPPLLPEILKKYTKGVLKTQPRDLLQWSVSYFRCLAKGEVPPVKEQLEYPRIESKGGLSPGLLRVLHQQLKGKKYVTLKRMKEKWKGVCLDMHELDALVHMAHLGEKFKWDKLLDLCAGSIGRNMSDTMKIICEVLTEQPDGVDPYVIFDVWWDHYIYLAHLAKIDGEQIQTVYSFLKRLASANYNLIGPREFLHQDCPPLQ